jgi:hypothetical protein
MANQTNALANGFQAESTRRFDTAAEMPIDPGDSMIEIAVI